VGGHGSDAIAHQPVHRRREDGLVVVVEAEHQAGIHHHAAGVGAAYGLVVLPNAVLRLAALAQAAGVHALEPDEQAPASGRRHGVQQRLFTPYVGGDRGVPGQAEAAQLGQQLPHPGGVADEVVVNEHDVVNAERLDLAEDVRDRLHAVARLDVVGAVVAEAAAERAASADRQRVGEQVLAVVKQFPSRDRGGGDVNRAAVAVDGVQAAAGGIVQHPRPERFGLADRHRVGVQEAVLGADGRVDAAEDHGDAAAAVGIGQGEGARGGVNLDRDADEVRRVVEALAGHVLIGERDAVFGRGQRAQDEEGQRRRHPGLPRRVHRAHGDTRADELDVHGEVGSGGIGATCGPGIGNGR